MLCVFTLLTLLLSCTSNGEEGSPNNGNLEGVLEEEQRSVTDTVPTTPNPSPDTSTPACAIQDISLTSTLGNGTIDFPLWVVDENALLAFGSLGVWRYDFSGDTASKRLIISDEGEAIAAHPDGSLAAIIDYPTQEISIWDIPNETRLGTITHSTTKRVHGAFSPAGDLLVTSSYDGRITVWDVATLEAVENYELPRVVEAGWGNTGQLLAFQYDETSTVLIIWDLVQEQELARSPTFSRSISRAKVDLDSERVIITDFGGNLAVLDMRTGEEITRQEFVPFGDFTVQPDRVVLARPSQSPGSGFLISFDVLFFDLATQTSERLATTGYSLSDTAQHPENDRLAIVGSGLLEVLDVQTGEVIYTDQFEHAVQPVVLGETFFLKASTMAPIGNETEHYELEMISYADGKVRHTWTLNGPVVALAVSPGDQWMAVATRGGRVALINTETGELQDRVVQGFDQVSHLSLNADGTILAVGGNYLVQRTEPEYFIRVWDVEAADLYRPDIDLDERLGALSLNHSGTQLAYSLFEDDMLTVLDIENPEADVQKAQIHFPITNIQFDRHTANRLGLTTANGVFQLWSGDPLQQMHGLAIEPGQSHRFTMAENLLFIGNGQLIEVYDMLTDDLVAEVAGHTSFVDGLALPANGHMLFSHAHDGTVRVWDIQYVSQ